jgi:hypothetical protein
MAAAIESMDVGEDDADEEQERHHMDYRCSSSSPIELQTCQSELHCTEAHCFRCRHGRAQVWDHVNVHHEGLTDARSSHGASAHLVVDRMSQKFGGLQEPTRSADGISGICDRCRSVEFVGSRALFGGKQSLFLSRAL